MRRQPRSIVLALCVVLAGACTSPEEYAADADAEVFPMLDATEAAVLADRDARMQQPEPAAPEEPADAGAQADAGADAEDRADAAVPGAEGPPEAGQDVEHIDLASSLETAFTSSREFLDQRDSVYLQGLGLSLARYDFGPILDSTIATIWQDAEDQQSTTSTTALLGVTDILPSGGTVGLLGTLGVATLGGQAPAGFDDPEYDSSAVLTLNQPLMRGFGYEVSHEALTQAERDLVYAVRDFELFRETFSISIADDYFSLVSRRQQLAVLEQTWKDSIFDQHQAEAMRQVDRNEDEDVFLARRRAIDTENLLLTEQADYLEAVDRFKVRLGLPPEVRVVIAEEDPPYQPVSLDADSAVTVALNNRLDLQTAADRLEDDERQLRISADALRPQLDLGVVAGLGDTGDSVSEALPDDWNGSAALTLGLPLDRQAERNAYRSAQIGLDQSRRDYDTLLDDVDRDVRNQLRQLRTIEQQVDLQREQIAQEQRAVAISEIRYEAGDVDNRALLDARASLALAQNELIDLLARHLISRLRLMQSMGVLVVRPDGSWTA